ncbi:MAG: DUF1272 domain-containing protein [Promethearchaeota archaeon]
MSSSSKYECPFCKQILKTYSKFCKNCGGKLSLKEGML